MYELRFTATDDSDWAQAIDIIDATTDAALADAATALFELDVTDNGSSLLSATTADNTITRPETGVIQWVFTEAQLAALCPGKTYKVGCRMTPVDGNSILLFTGTLTFLDGGMA